MAATVEQDGPVPGHDFFALARRRLDRARGPHPVFLPGGRGAGPAVLRRHLGGALRATVITAMRKACTAEGRMLSMVGFLGSWLAGTLGQEDEFCPPFSCRTFSCHLGIYEYSNALTKHL